MYQRERPGKKEQTCKGYVLLNQECLGTAQWFEWE